MQKLSRFIVIAAVLMLSLVAVQPSMAQNSATGHLVVTLSPATIVGDFFINDQPVGAQVHQIELDQPTGVSLKIVVRNIQPPSAGYRWNEGTSTVKLVAGRVRKVTITVRKERLLTGEKLAAITSMQRTLDAGRQTWLAIATNFWTPIGNGEKKGCEFSYRPAALPRVSASTLKKYPLYKDAFDMLSNAINTTNFSIQQYNKVCQLAHGSDEEHPYGITDNDFYEGVTAKNNAENMFNQAQDKLNALTNNPQ